MKLSSNPQSTRLINVACQLVEHLPDVDLRAAFLFGSAAWGDANAASDLDIMLLLDRPAGYREVTCIRLADLLGYPLPDGPVFADLDCIAVETFVSSLQTGNWAQRVVNSVILADTDDFYVRLRSQVSTAFWQPSARRERFLAKQKQSDESRTAALKVSGIDDMLSALHARLALQHASAALIELSGNRVSPSHFVESLEKALNRFDSSLFARCLAALSLNAPYTAVERSLRAYDVFADAIKRWVHDPGIENRFSQEDLAWARHTYGKQEEIMHKIAELTRTKRLPALLYYLDGLFQVPICIQTSKIFQLRSSGKAERMAVPDFQVALHQEPALYEAWIAALRLSAERDQVLEVINLTRQLLNVGKAALETDKPLRI
jgi:predicted nucleotidyltransferase